MFALTTTIQIILCLMFAARSRQETPQYSYECKENGDIVLHGFPSKHSSYIQLTTVANESCIGETYKSDSYGHITIPKECTNGTNLETDRTAVFRAVDSLIDGTTEETPVHVSFQQSVTPSFGQRRHNFGIKCSMIKQGVVDHVIGHVGVKNVALLPNVYNSIGTVEMRFKSEEATKEINLNDLPDISTVYLGDKFYMYLKYIGDQGYTISPQNCTAYGNGQRAILEKGKAREERVELWTYGGCLSDVSKNLRLMHSFKQLSGQIMYAEMFGFHFDIDADITIECDVKVCPPSSSDKACKLSVKADCKSKDWKIVKRSTREEEDNRVAVKGKLHVLERKIGNGNSSGFLRFKWTSLVILQVLLYLY